MNKFVVSAVLLVLFTQTDGGCCADFPQICDIGISKIAQSCSGGSGFYYTCSELQSLGYCSASSPDGERARRQCPATCGSCPKATDETLCFDSCPIRAEDGQTGDCGEASSPPSMSCSDGGPGSFDSQCTFGTDCTDCGERAMPPTPSPTTKSPTKSPSKTPTFFPTKFPTTSPSKSPTQSPSKAPTQSPSQAPTNLPNTYPTKSPVKRGGESDSTSAPSKSPLRSTQAPNTQTGGSSGSTQSPTTASITATDENNSTPGAIVGIVAGVVASVCACGCFGGKRWCQGGSQGEVAQEDALGAMLASKDVAHSHENETSQESTLVVREESEDKENETSRVPIHEEGGEKVGETWEYDAFLSHEWGVNGEVHEIVRNVNEYLKGSGIKTWFDNDRLSGDISAQISNGLENSCKVVVFITRRYMEKVNSEDENFCKKEFGAACRVRTVANIVPCVLEENMLNPNQWRGPLQLHLGSQLYIDFSSQRKREANFHMLLERLQSKDNPEERTTK